MSRAPVACAACKKPLPWTLFNSGGDVACPSCGVPMGAAAFPALLQTVDRGAAGGEAVDAGGSACFYHPGKPARTICDGCGRFLCALCDVDFNQQHYCPACLEAGAQKGRMKHLEKRRILHDDIAVSLAALPLLIWPLTLLTAPMAAYYAVRHWKTPTSIMPRTKARLVVALALALLQIAGWILLAAGLMNAFNADFH